MITALKKADPHFKTNELCRVFEMSSSSFYYQAQLPNEEKQRATQLIEQIFEDSIGTYGKRRIQAELIVMV